MVLTDASENNATARRQLRYDRTNPTLSLTLQNPYQCEKKQDCILTALNTVWSEPEGHPLVQQVLRYCCAAVPEEAELW